MARARHRQERAAGLLGIARPVLVLDDHPVNRASMVEFLRHAGYRALEGSLAVEVAAARAALLPALLVLHIFPLGPSEANVIRELRRLPGFAATPILAVSATTSTAVRRYALQAGATAFLELPLDRQTFLDAVAHLVEKPRAGEGAGISEGQGR